MPLPRLLGAGLLAAALTGCASFVAPPYSADFVALDRLKRAPLEKASVGTFQPVDGAAEVNRIKLRAVTLVSPRGSFSRYLQDALAQDLREIAVYDEAAQIRIDAVVLKNVIDISSMSTGTGLMEVELAVTRGGQTRLKKLYTASTQFESSFAGAVAIPKGQSEYGVLVRALLGKVYSDPDFINALKKQGS